MHRIDAHAFPEDEEEMITFRLGGDASMSESRKGGPHWDYGTDCASWPPYIVLVANYIARSRAEEGLPDTEPRFWIIRVKGLKQVLAGNLSEKAALDEVFAALADRVASMGGTAPDSPEKERIPPKDGARRRSKRKK